MKLYYFPFILLLITFQGFSQSFSWGYPFGIPEETEKNITHIVDDKLYRISSHYDLNVFNHEIILDQFTLNELEKVKSINLSVEQPQMGSASLTFNSMFQNDGTDFTFFYTEFDRKTKTYHLYFRDVDINTGRMGELTPVTNMEVPSVSNSGEYIISQSQDKTYFSVLHQMPFEKKSTEKIRLLLLDSDKKIVKEKTHDFGVEDNRRKQQSISVSDTGQVFLIKKIEEKKQKPFLNLYNWNTTTDAISEESLKQEDNYQLHQFSTKFHENAFYIFGILTHEKSSDFGLKIDFNGRHSGVPGSSLLTVKISGDGNTQYIHRSDFPEIISNLNISDIHFSEENIWVVYNRAYVEKKSSTTNLSQGNYTYDYKYLNNGFFLNLIKEETGAVEWIQKIDTNEPNTSNDNGDYLSALTYTDSGNLVLLYNETRDLNTGVVRNPFLRRFPIQHVISPSGDTIQQEALLSAGIGVTKEERFELNTSVIIPVSENTYIIRARNNAEYKYGYMRF